MTRLKTLLILIILVLGAASAQECLNHIAVDGRLLDGDGFAGQSACYFVSHGDSSNAYARASLLARALGLELSFDDASKTLIFRQGSRAARYRTTTDIAQGLQRRGDVFTVDGAPYDGGRAIPMAIVVNGTSWVPVYPVADAFGSDVEWDSGAKTIFIDTAARKAQLEREAEAARAQQAQTPHQTQAPQGAIGPPRVGRDQGVTRVALDLPAGVPYEVAVKDRLMVITLPGLEAAHFTFGSQDPNVADLRYALLGGTLALVIDTHHPLTSSGQGFKVGLVDRGDQEVLYVDFSPQQQGQSVAALNATPVLQPLARAEPQPAARAPSVRRKSIVIDAGHGGRFGGTRSPSGVREEDVVLAIALKVRDILTARGFEVVMTRTTNTHLAEIYAQDLRARANAATTDHNLFVSIHANAASNRAAHGIETFIFGEPLSEEVRQQAIRENGGGAVGRAATDQAIDQAAAWSGDLIAQRTLQLSRSLAHYVQSSLISKTGANDRGVKQAPFLVLRQARIPAILVEVGFLTNPDEEARLVTAAYQQKLAEAIAAGIINFFEGNGAFANR